MLKRWLSKNECWVKKGDTCTHTFMDRGSFRIKKDKQEAFNKIYCECVRKKERLSIVEQRTRPTFNFFVDVDFVDEEEMSQDILSFICTTCQSAINSDDTVIVCTSKPRTINNKIKTGLHLHWNRLIHENEVPSIVEIITTKLNNEFPNYNWTKFIDTSVYNGGGLRMKWSYKYQNGNYFDPYLPIMEITPNSDIPRLIPAGISCSVLTMVSIRDNDVQPVPFLSKLQGSIDETPTEYTEPSSELESWVRENMRGQEHAKIKHMLIYSTCALLGTESKYCEIKGCAHVSNHIYFYIDFRTNTIHQRCWDDECKNKNKRTHRATIPLSLIIQYKPNKLDFIQNDSRSAVMNNFLRKSSKYK